MNWSSLTGGLVLLSALAAEGAEVTSVIDVTGKWRDAATWVGERIPSTNDEVVVRGTVTVERAWCDLSKLRLEPRWRSGAQLHIGPEAGLAIHDGVRGRSGAERRVELAVRGVMTAQGIFWGSGRLSVEGGLLDVRGDGLSLRGYGRQSSRLVVSGGGTVAVTRMRVSGSAEIDLHGGRIGVGDVSLTGRGVHLRLLRGTMRVSRRLRVHEAVTIELGPGGEGELALKGRWDVDRLHDKAGQVGWLVGGREMEPEELALAPGEGWLAGYTVIRGR